MNSLLIANCIVIIHECVCVCATKMSQKISKCFNEEKIKEKRVFLLRFVMVISK
jgi:hypothetical protein